MENTTFVERLLVTLTELEHRYIDLIARSTIQNVDPNSGDANAVFVGFPRWGWRPDERLVSDRTQLLADLEEWFPLFRLLHRSALPETTRRIDDAIGLLRRWLAREVGDHSVPPTVDRAQQMTAVTFEDLRALVALANRGPGGLLVVPDTNALIRCPDVANYGAVLGTEKFSVVLVTTVLAELDDLKDRGRSPEVRNAAGAAVRRIKGLRDRGTLHTGVPVAGKTTLRAEHREVRPRDVLDWLHPNVPDDQILAAALDLQARHPSTTVTLVTADINLQNKADVVGVPFADVPD